MRSTRIEHYKQLSRYDAGHKDHGLWRMALYNLVLLNAVFETFCELANVSPIWANTVLETIFCVNLEPQDEEAPFNHIVKAGIKIPANISIVRIAGLLHLLKYMEQNPLYSENVISWLIDNKHKSRFKYLFVDILIRVGRSNKHLENVIQDFLTELTQYPAWVFTVSQIRDSGPV